MRRAEAHGVALHLCSRSVQRKGGWRILAAAVSSAALCGCATFSSTIQSTERSLAAQQPKLALLEFEKRVTPGRDRVLYLMNKGLLLRMIGDYDASTKALEQAKGIVETLRAVSLREQATSLLINDSAQSYVGDDFEQVMIHTYLALNYLEQHRLEPARVEALQVDVLLRQFAQATPDSPYSEDAFARYLTGIIYEERSEWSDAMIAYRKAYEAYRAQEDALGLALPETLKHDLIRLADRMGLTEEAEGYRRSFGIKETLSAAALQEQGELIFTLHSGLAPIKREQSITMTNPGTGRLIRLSLPTYQVRRQPVAYARLEIGSRSATSARVENVDAIAVKTLEARMPAVTARALARMVAKDRIAREAGDRGGAQGLLGVAVNVANTLTERADTRSWFTLPGQIHLARVPLPAGRHRGRIELVQGEDHVLHTSDIEFVLNKGEKTYLSQHWIPPNLEVRP